MESQQKTLLKFDKLFKKIYISFTISNGKNIYTIKESLIYSTLYAQAVPQTQHNTSPSAVSDPQILKLTPNERQVQIQH